MSRLKNFRLLSLVIAVAMLVSSGCAAGSGGLLGADTLGGGGSSCSSSGFS